MPVLLVLTLGKAADTPTLPPSGIGVGLHAEVYTYEEDVCCSSTTGLLNDGLFTFILAC
jgi:hypothetical protein